VINYLEPDSDEEEKKEYETVENTLKSVVCVNCQRETRGLKDAYYFEDCNNLF